VPSGIHLKMASGICRHPISSTSCEVVIAAVPTALLAGKAQAASARECDMTARVVVSNEPGGVVLLIPALGPQTGSAAPLRGHCERCAAASSTPRARAAWPRNPGSRVSLVDIEELLS
jgi:hypothetical protein